MSETAGYGSWKSPITAELISGGSVGLSQPRIDSKGIYWIEMRPSEAGRNVIVRRDPSGQVADLNPPPFNARTRVHEYGGGDYVVSGDDLFFSNFVDQRLYTQTRGTTPRPITPVAQVRFAEPIFDNRRGRLISVCEDHRVADREPVNSLVSLCIESNEDGGRVLVAGNDFYSSPRISPDGSKLAWLTWNHPNMPWDGTELWLGELGDDGLMLRTERVAGGTSESIFQPEWSPEGILYFVSDRNGWWNLYRKNAQGEIETVCEREAEFGMPQWLFGMSTYAFESEELIVCTNIERGASHLAIVDTRRGDCHEIESPYTDISFLRAAPGQAVFRAGSPGELPAIVRFDLTRRDFEVLRRSNDAEIDKGFISVSRAVEFPTEHGLSAYGFFYPPQNRDSQAPAGELPPLIVKSHGGPTAATTSSLSLSIQYWTSRGIGVLDVNYGGSTGYGRAYRERLNDKWGVVDIDDCVNGARYLVERGEADASRLIITGASAGGYTTLCALAFRDTFKAGASYFGVSDAEALARDTHKFESRYLDRLLGPYPERKDVYYQRSPINFTERLSCPVIFFQGLEDKVVPPNQAEVMVEALRSKGIPVAYVPFAGEQHGFRKAENIKRSLEAELYFYSRVFDFELPEPVEPVEIQNLKGAVAGP